MCFEVGAINESTKRISTFYSSPSCVSPTHLYQRLFSFPLPLATPATTEPENLGAGLSLRQQHTREFMDRAPIVPLLPWDNLLFFLQLAKRIDTKCYFEFTRVGQGRSIGIGSRIGSWLAGACGFRWHTSLAFSIDGAPNLPERLARYTLGGRTARRAWHQRAGEICGDMGGN